MSKGGEGMSEQSGSVLVDHYSSSEKYVGRGKKRKKRAWISCKDETWPKIEAFSSVEFFIFFFKYATDTLFLKEHGLLDLQFVILLGITIISRACLAPKVCGFRAGSAHPSQKLKVLVWWFGSLGCPASWQASTKTVGNLAWLCLRLKTSALADEGLSLEDLLVTLVRPKDCHVHDSLDQAIMDQEVSRQLLQWAAELGHSCPEIVWRQANMNLEHLTCV